MVMACNNRNVKEIIHVSALGVSDSAPSEYLRSKHAAEKILEQFNGNSVILRPSVVFGPGDSFMNLFCKNAEVFSDNAHGIDKNAISADLYKRSY